MTRNHPALRANDWFEHMLFADDLGHRPVRAPGDLRPLILAALAGRNYSLDGSAPATLTLKNGTEEVVAGGPGSRSKPILVKLAPSESASYHLSVSLKDSPTYHFQFPVTVILSKATR